MFQDLFTQPVFSAVRLSPLKPSRDKKVRASGWVSRAKKGQFKLVSDHWNQDFINECIVFDGQGHSHDDQVDAVSGAYELIWDLKGRILEPEPVVEVGSYRFIKDLVAANNPGSGFIDRSRPIFTPADPANARPASWGHDD